MQCGSLWTLFATTSLGINAAGALPCTLQKGGNSIRAIDRRERGSPDALEGGGRKALADGAGNHENEGHQVDLLPAQVVTADSKSHLQVTRLMSLGYQLQCLSRGMPAAGMPALATAHYPARHRSGGQGYVRPQADSGTQALEAQDRPCRCSVHACPK